MAHTRLDGQRFGDVALSRLTWQEIEALYSEMRSAGLGVDWIRRCATVLTRALEFARKRGLLDANPAKDATRPRTARSRPIAPAGDEVRKALATAAERDPEVADAVTVLVSTGMRRGELLALRWCDVDFTKEEVHVDAAITDGGRGVGILRKTTKRADWRDVPLTGGAVEALRRQAARRRDLLSVDPGPVEYIFPRGIDGSLPLRPDSMGDRWATARGVAALGVDLPEQPLLGLPLGRQARTVLQPPQLVRRRLIPGLALAVVRSVEADGTERHPTIVPQG